MIQKTPKCYNCGQYGHYKNECTMIQKTPKKLLNAEEIINFIISEKKIVNFIALLESSEKLIFHFNQDQKKITSSQNTPLEKSIGFPGITLDQFISLIESTGTFTTIFYQTRENDLKSMIFELNREGLTEIVEVEPNREEHYKLKNKVVMKSRRHSTDWTSRVCEDETNLICDVYDQHKNDERNSKNDIIFVTQTIKILYT
jgi:hypothetical protein